MSTVKITYIAGQVEYIYFLNMPKKIELLLSSRLTFPEIYG